MAIIESFINLFSSGMNKKHLFKEAEEHIQVIDDINDNIKKIIKNPNTLKKENIINNSVEQIEEISENLIPFVKGFKKYAATNYLKKCSREYDSLYESIKSDLILSKLSFKQGKKVCLKSIKRD